MKVAMVVDVLARGHLVTWSKVVDMPCLPPVGTVVWLETKDNWVEANVDSIGWYDDAVRHFEVQLSRLDFGMESEDEVRQWFTDLGWARGDDWWKEHPKEARNGNDTETPTG